MIAVSTGIVDITPPMSLPMGGYGVDDPRLGLGTNEPLTARCTVVWNGVRPFVVVSADTLGFRQGAHTRIREGVVALRVPSSAFVLTATHTHNAPALDEGLDPFVAYDLEDLGPTVAYTSWLVGRIIGLVQHVLIAPRTPCTLEYLVTDADFSFNREALPYTERDVPVLVARDLAGHPRAVLFSYGAHPVAAGLQVVYDPDYPAQAIKQICEAYPLAHAQFMLGPAGDQNPVAMGTFAIADSFGADLGTTIANAIAVPGRPLQGPTRAVYTTVALPLDISLRPEHVAMMAEAFAVRAEHSVVGYVRRHAQRMLDYLTVAPLSLLETSVRLPVQRWGFAGEPDLTVLFSGGEVVSGYAVVLRAENGGSDGLWFLGYANEVPSYVPSEQLLDHPCYAGGIDTDFSFIAGGSMTVYNHLTPYRRASTPGAGDSTEDVYLDHVRGLI